MGREIHFYTYEPRSISILAYFSWNDTIEAISKKQPCIYTTQMGLLSTQLFEDGYRIFIHEIPRYMYEIKLGGKNLRTNREVKMGYNLFSMWRAGEFDAEKKKE